jgi:hypothetical protein
MTGCDLDVSEVDAGIETGRNEGMTEHVRAGPGDPDAGGLGEVLQAAGGRVLVHPGVAAV